MNVKKKAGNTPKKESTPLEERLLKRIELMKIENEQVKSELRTV